MQPIRRALLAVPLLLVAGTTAAAADQVVEHRLRVHIDPAAGTLQVQDALTLPGAPRRQVVYLHQGLAPRVSSGDARLEPLGQDGPLERFALTPGAGAGPITLAYGGTIRHGLEQVAESPGRSHPSSRGNIGPDGVFLDRASGWYPYIEDTLQRFTLEVGLPPGWSAVSQGAGPSPGPGAGPGAQVQWREDRPQDDIYLVAAPFHLYRQATPVAEAQVYLRHEDPALARRYLAATSEYLQIYSHLLGPYAYPKLALVENNWASGLGMPSFTLLGSQVIRLPFIVYSSYPHEILHNWWGNGVYVDYGAGNWSEGLTTYLADYLMQERAGRGAAYRHDALQRYANYVRSGQDFPLRRFQARHSGASQAVGYDKGLMLFHMLRRRLGDQVFIRGLRRFYRDNLSRSASWADLQRAFEQVSGRDLRAFFAEWLDRTGAPTLALSDLDIRALGDGYRITGLLRQTQAQAPYTLRVPVLVEHQGGPPLEAALSMQGRGQRFELRLASRPLLLAVDPCFDLFRTLYPKEAPPSLGALLGAEQGLMLLPAAAPTPLLAAYRALAEQWTQGYPNWRVRLDREVTALPRDRPVWVLGWENRFRDSLAAPLQGLGAALSAQGARVQGQELRASRDSLALAVPAATPSGATRGFLGASDPASVAGLSRKLPHYGKYGIVAFRGRGPKRFFEAQWPVTGSPLTRALAADAGPLTPPPEPVLTDAFR
jgi:aminopeptidase N